MILNSRRARLSIDEVSCISRDLGYYYSVTSDKHLLFHLHIRSRDP
jgi:hypothetical protein